MSNGAKIAIVILIAALVATGGIYFAQNNDDSHGKNSGNVLVSVTNTYITSVPVKIYIDGDLVQDTTLSPMGGGSGQKKVSWSSGDRYTVTVKVVYKPGSVEQTVTRQAILNDGGTQLVSISL